MCQGKYAMIGAYQWMRYAVGLRQEGLEAETTIWILVQHFVKRKLLALSNTKKGCDANGK